MKMVRVTCIDGKTRIKKSSPIRHPLALVGERNRSGWLVELSGRDQHRLRNLESTLARVKTRVRADIMRKWSTFFYDCMQKESWESPFGKIKDVWIARDAREFYRYNPAVSPCSKCEVECDMKCFCSDYLLWSRARTGACAGE